MNLGEIIKSVQRQLGDESEVQFEKADIKRWANDAQVDIARKTECLQEHSETSAVSEDGSYLLPADFIGLKRVSFDKSVIQPTTLDNADKSYPNRDRGEGSTGSPSTYYVWGRTLHLYPWPEQGGIANLDIWYYRAPKALAADEDIPEIPSWMHEDIVRYCIARGKELDEEDAQSQKAMTEYDVRVAESRHEAQNPQADSYPSVRLVSGDDW